MRKAVKRSGFPWAWDAALGPYPRPVGKRGAEFPSVFTLNTDVEST